MNRSPCQDWEAFYDRELNASDHAAFVAHLPSCCTCLDRLLRLEQLETDVLAAWCLFSEEETGTAVVPTFGSLPTVESTRRSRSRWVTYVGVVAAMAAAGLLVLPGSPFELVPRTQDLSVETKPPLDKPAPLEVLPQQQVTAGPMSDVQINFTAGTDGMKVVSRPTFLYVHVFPTVKRIPIQRD
jgi:hypothetical protein